jgi:hypothetical protein
MSIIESDITILNSDGTVSNSTLPLNQDIKKLIQNSLNFYDSNRNRRSKNIIIENSTNTLSELRLDFPIRNTRFNNTYPNIPSGETLSNIVFTCRIKLTSFSFLNLVGENFVYTFRVSNPLNNNTTLSANARILHGNLILPEPVNRSNIIALKEVEKNEDGTLGFQKNQTRQGTTTVDGPDLKFTKINLDNILNPNANLAMSFNIPITTPQISSYLSRFNNTSLQSVIQPTANTSTYNNKFILVEIPQNKYGEIIDGKTIELNIPVKSGSTIENYSLYSTYFRSNTQPNTLNYNTLLSDPNPFSSYFSDVNPSLNNDNNSNVSYLFSNQVNKPLSNTTVLSDLIYSATNDTTSNSGDLFFSTFFNLNETAQTRIKFNRNGIVSDIKNQNQDRLVIPVSSNYILQDLNGNELPRVTREFSSDDPFYANQESPLPFSLTYYEFVLPTLNNDLIFNIRCTSSRISSISILCYSLGDRGLAASTTYNLTTQINKLIVDNTVFEWNKKEIH